MTQKESLEIYRKKIDAIDDKLLGLLNDRARIAQEIGRVKEKKNETVLASDRERDIVNRLAKANKGPIAEESLHDIFGAIFATCRSLQKRLKISFFGPEATFTHQVALKYFGRISEFVALPTIKDVFSEVERGGADYGVVPIENSTEGVVNHTLDMFLESDLVITAEREEPISQHLLSISGEKKSIKHVFSHPQAIAQCRKWMEAHLPNVQVHESASTADAAVQATLDKSSAAIASALAGQIYQLKTVASHIEDFSTNATRFLIVGKNGPTRTGQDKTSILFSVKDKVGALFEMLEPFRKASLNLTKIESRPTKKKAWEYIFFVDFIGHQSEPHVQAALKELQKGCTTFKVLGSYPYGA